MNINEYMPSTCFPLSSEYPVKIPYGFIGNRLPNVFR